MSNRVYRDKIFNHVNTTDVSKIPRWNSLAEVGDEQGFEGDVILDRSTGQLCYHDGLTWVCLGASGPIGPVSLLNIGNQGASDVYVDGTGPDPFQIRGIIEGSGISVTEGANNITIANTAKIVNSNVGGGVDNTLINNGDPASGDYTLYGLTEGNNITISQVGDNLQISAIGGGGSPGGIIIENQDVPIDLDTTVINFTGTGVKASGGGGTVEVNVPGIDAGDGIGVSGGVSPANWVISNTTKLGDASAPAVTNSLIVNGDPATGDYTLLGLVAGSNVSISKVGNDLEISAVGGGGGGSPTDGLWDLNGNEFIQNTSVIGVDFGGNNLLFGSDQLNSGGVKDTRMFFIGDSSGPIDGLGSFRVGSATGTEWDGINRGDHSVAMGYNNLASASGSGVLCGGVSTTTPSVPNDGNKCAAISSVIAGGCNNEIVDGLGDPFGTSSHNGILCGFSNTLGDNLLDNGACYASAIVTGIGNKIDLNDNVLSRGNAIIAGNLNNIRAGSAKSSAGNFNVIGGGQESKILYASNCFIGGGFSNLINYSVDSAIVAGEDNIIDSVFDRNFIGAGEGNQINQASKDCFIGAGGADGVGNGNIIGQASRAAFIGAGGGTGVPNKVYSNAAGIVIGLNNVINNSSDNSIIGAGDGNIIGSTSPPTNIDNVFIGAGVNNKVYGSSSGILIGSNNTITDTITNSSVTAGNNQVLDQRDTTLTQNLRVGDERKNTSSNTPVGGVQFQSVIKIASGLFQQLTFEDHTIVFTNGPLEPSPLTTALLPSPGIVGQRYYFIAEYDGPTSFPVVFAQIDAGPGTIVNNCPGFLPTPSRSPTLILPLEGGSGSNIWSLCLICTEPNTWHVIC